MQVGHEKSLFSTNILLHCVLSTLQPSGVINTVPPHCGKLVTFIAGIRKWRRLLIAGDDDKEFMRKSLNVMRKPTEHIHLHILVNLLWPIIKDCAQGTVLLKLSTDRRSTARPLCDSRARASRSLQLLVLLNTTKIKLFLSYCRCADALIHKH